MYLGFSLLASSTVDSGFRVGNMLCITQQVTGADPASKFDQCTIRLLKDHHIFSLSKCQGREGGGGGFLTFHEFILTSPLVGILRYLII